MSLAALARTVAADLTEKARAATDQREARRADLRAGAMLRTARWLDEAPPSETTDVATWDVWRERIERERAAELQAQNRDLRLQVALQQRELAALRRDLAERDRRDEPRAKRTA